MPKFSKKAKRHAATSKQDKRRQLQRARKPAPVTVSYLPGFEPKEQTPQSKTKFPFIATINGHPYDVHSIDGKIVLDRWEWLDA